jgi:hypothetical protein
LKEKVAGQRDDTWVFNGDTYNKASVVSTSATNKMRLARKISTEAMMKSKKTTPAMRVGDFRAAEGNDDRGRAGNRYGVACAEGVGGTHDKEGEYAGDCMRMK